MPSFPDNLGEKPPLVCVWMNEWSFEAAKAQVAAEVTEYKRRSTMAFVFLFFFFHFFSGLFPIHPKPILALCLLACTYIFLLVVVWYNNHQQSVRNRPSHCTRFAWCKNITWRARICWRWPYTISTLTMRKYMHSYSTSTASTLVMWPTWPTQYETVS